MYDFPSMCRDYGVDLNTEIETLAKRLRVHPHQFYRATIIGVKGFMSTPRVGYISQESAQEEFAQHTTTHSRKLADGRWDILASVYEKR